MRTSTIKRETNETNIALTLNLDGTGTINIDTPVPFFNHMLTALSFYAGWDLEIKASGDVEIDDHHLIEDVGIVLGTTFKEALGNKQGIARFASALTPMDESLSQVVVDLSNRPMLIFKPDFKRDSIGGLSLENVKEFFYAFAIESRITLHLSIQYGYNDHHKVESLFKGVGRALSVATTITKDGVVSTKGVL